MFLNVLLVALLSKVSCHNHDGSKDDLQTHDHIHTHPDFLSHSSKMSPQSLNKHRHVPRPKEHKSSTPSSFKILSNNSEDNSSTCKGYEGEVWVGGLSAIIVFYLVILVVGAWAGWTRRGNEVTQEQVLLAGRDLGLFVGVLTMGATWVGGGFINGSAQGVYSKGLIWTQAPFGYALSLVLGGTFFAGKMRESRYITMIDPFTNKYGKWGALMVIPAAVSEIFWSAAILGALGSTLHVILHLDDNVSIIVSAIIALGYTLFGGLVSVAYTDVIQIFFIVVGLFLALPFALTHPAVENIYQAVQEDGVTPAWYGRVADHEWGEWLDYALLCLMGGIPWQCYFQRVLSAQTSTRAQLLSYGGAAIALVMTGPAVLFGAVARATNWEETDYPCSAPSGETAKLVMPLTLQYLTPPAVSWFGLGAVSAAVMSSTDSSLLSASSLIARNIYQKVFRPGCGEKEVVVALWIIIICNCVISTTLAIQYKSIYELFVLCGDFTYVILFPQLLLVLYWSSSNTYGAISSFFVSLILRLLMGDKYLGLPAVISFGTISEPCATVDAPELVCQGDVPYRTIVMLIGLVVHILISGMVHIMFCFAGLSLRWDFLKCFHAVREGYIVELRNTRENDSPVKSLKDKLETQAKYVGKFNKRRGTVTVM